MPCDHSDVGDRLGRRVSYRCARSRRRRRSAQCMPHEWEGRAGRAGMCRSDTGPRSGRQIGTRRPYGIQVHHRRPAAASRFSYGPCDLAGSRQSEHAWCRRCLERPSPTEFVWCPRVGVLRHTPVVRKGGLSARSWRRPEWRLASLLERKRAGASCAQGVRRSNVHCAHRLHHEGPRLGEVQRLRRRRRRSLGAAQRSSSCATSFLPLGLHGGAIPVLLTQAPHSGWVFVNAASCSP